MDEDQIAEDAAELEGAPTGDPVEESDEAVDEPVSSVDNNSVPDVSVQVEETEPISVKKKQTRRVSKKNEDEITDDSTDDTSGDSVYNNVFDGVLIKSGSKGPNVEKIQAQLKIEVTGIFNRDTLKAVRRFQAQYKLHNDGIVGEETWNRLFN